MANESFNLPTVSGDKIRPGLDPDGKSNSAICKVSLTQAYGTAWTPIAFLLQTSNCATWVREAIIMWSDVRDDI